MKLANDRPEIPIAKTSKFAIVDIETTGLRFDRDHILQIAVVLQDWTAAPTSVWSTYVRPSQWWSRDLGPHHVHGISRRHLVFAPPIQKALHTFAELTKDRIIVAHNADFDTKFLRTAAQLHDIELEWAGIVCTLNMSRKLDSQRQETHKLATLCEKYGITLDRAHHAEFDARATAQLLTHLLEAHKIQGNDDLQPFVRS